MEWFTKISKLAGVAAGSPIAFVVALTMIVSWIIAGPFMDYSNTWQLLINTTTSIITFLMVFIIQRSQNQDTVSIQIKLDELLKSIEGADKRLMDLEELSSQELEELHAKYEKQAENARASSKQIS